MKKILILTSSGPRSRKQSQFAATRKLASGLEKLQNFEVVYELIQQISFVIEADKVEAYLSSGRKLTEFDGIYIKRSHEEPWFGSALSDLLSIRKKKHLLLNTEYTQVVNVNKFVEALRFRLNNLPTPKTLFAVNIDNLVELACGELSFPFIFKAAEGSKGKDNYLVHSKKELKKIAKNHVDELFIAQELIPNNCDYRVLLFDDEPKLIIERKRIGNDTHLNNTSMGAQATQIAAQEFDGRALNMAVQASRVFDLSISGVDLLKNAETGEWYVLEVNSAPDLTGSFAEEKSQLFSDYIVEHV